MESYLVVGDAPVRAAASVLQIIYAARSVLDRMLAQPEAHANQFALRVSEIGRFLTYANGRSRDVAIASILLCQDGAYPIRHAVNVAMLVDLALSELGRDGMERLPVVSAALTMNIGMHGLQDALSRQSGPLTAEQRQAMQEHPVRGRELLRQLGVADTVWLDCVELHHEAPDGSGYPHHLSGAVVSFEARLIGLADRYCAILSRNAWRRGQLSDSALFTSLGAPTGTMDTKLARLFTQTIGIYPPGALVQLLNGELGLVKQRGSSEGAPIVAALFDKNGRELDTPQERNSALDGLSIVSLLDSRMAPAKIDMQKVWGAEAAPNPL